MSQSANPSPASSEAEAPTDGASHAGLNLKAVLIGFAVDAGGSLVLGLAVGLVAGVAAIGRGATSAQVVEELTRSPGIRFFSLLAGLFMTVAGGYTAAALARRRRLKHGLAVGVLSAIYSVCGALAFQQFEWSWNATAMLAMIVPCAILGAWLAAPRPELPPLKL